MPNFYCDIAQQGWPFIHFWEHTVGSGHASFGLRADWQAQLKQCREDLGFQNVRFHGLFSNPIAPVRKLDEKTEYSFFNIDRIYDFLLSIGMRPFVELGFMPEPLASGKKTVFNYADNITPPTDYAEWKELVHELVCHCADRYGREEVQQWYFEVWNEPNLADFWAGTWEDYLRLYRLSAEAIKAVDSKIKVGGPATSRNSHIDRFLTFCAKNDVPLDFVSTHHYPDDTFGADDEPTETKLSKSIRSVLRMQAQDVKRQARGKPVFYTEWNTSSNPNEALHDQPYAAAFVAKTIMEAHGLVDGYSFWTFTDIFSEHYFPSEPYHGGFGLLNLYGIPKPTYRAFQLLHQLGDRQLMVDGLHDTVDAWVVKDKNKVDVLLTNHALPRHDIRTQQVIVLLEGSDVPARVSVARLDDDHANPRRAWLDLGEPEYLQETQIAELNGVSQLVWEPLEHEHDDGRLCLKLALPSHALAVLRVEYEDGVR